MKRILLILGACLVLGIILSLKIGLLGMSDPDVITYLRMPRLVGGLAVGMGLAVAGVILQALFSNPLCEPYTLGISAGATLGVVIGYSFFDRMGLGAPFFSGGFGALVASFVILMFSGTTRVSQNMLLLVGVMLGFVFSGLVSLWMALADPVGLQGAIYWLLGDLSRMEIRSSFGLFGFNLLISIFAWNQWRTLDGFILGQEGALSVGINIQQARKTLLILVSLLVTSSVLNCGIIGFIGLVIPHLCRLFVGSLHYRLIPVAALFGATVLIYADLGARTLFSPIEIPVGVVCSLAGAPVFIWLMLKRKDTL